MVTPTLMGPLARAAGIIESGHSVRTATCSWGYAVEEAESFDDVHEAAECRIFEMLADAGVAIGAPGHPQTTQERPDAPRSDAMLRPAAQRRPCSFQIAARQRPSQLH